MTNDAGSINLSLESLKGFLGKNVQYVLGFAGTIVFARLLGPTSFGGFYFLLSLVYVLDNPLRGLSTALEKRVSEVGSANRELLGGVLLIQFVAFVGVGIVLLATGELLTEQTNVENAPLVFFLLFVSMNLFLVSQQYLSGNGFPALQIWNDTFRSVATIVLQLGFVLSGLGAAGMGYGLAGATLLAVPVAHYFVPLRPSLPSRSTLRSLWRYAKYSIPNAMTAAAFSRLDILLIAFILSTGAAGLYETAYKLTMPATLLSTAIAPALMPKVSSNHSEGGDVSEDISNAIAFSSALAIPIFFGALAISEDVVVTVYGGEYREAASLLIGLALYQILNTQTTIYGRAINAIDKPDVNLRVSAIVLVLNVVLGIALVFPFGAIGVVGATIVAECGRYLMHVFYVRRDQRNVTILPRALVEQFLAGVAMFAVVTLASSWIAVTNWFGLLLLVGLGGVVYGAVLVAISASLRTTLDSVYRDVRA